MAPLFEKSGKKIRGKRLNYREDQSLCGWRGELLAGGNNKGDKAKFG